MKKVYVLMLLVLAGIGVVGVYAHMSERQFKLTLGEGGSHEYGAQPQVSNDSNFMRGEHGETMFQHPGGTDIIPPKKSSNEFSGYKSYRIGVLQDFASNNLGEIASAQVTFDEPLTVEEFENFVEGYSIEIIGLEGSLKDGRRSLSMHSHFVQNRGEYDSITNAVLEGSGEELLKVQYDSRVLFVDLNLEGRHTRIPPETPTDIEEQREHIIQRSQGTDIFPQYTDSNEFGSHKSQRIRVLQDLASNRPGESVSARVTFNALLTVEEFENFVKEHSIKISGVEGNYTDGRRGVLEYFAFDEWKWKYDSIFNTMVNGTGEELLKVQYDSRVLFVDLNREVKPSEEKPVGEKAKPILSKKLIDAFLYVTNHDIEEHVVLMIDLYNGAIIYRIPIGIKPLHMDYATRYLYVANLGSHDVTVIDLYRYKVVDSIPVGPRPHGITLTPDEKQAYVTDIVENLIYVIDTSTRNVTATIPVGEKPFNTAFTPDGKYAYVANRGINGSVSVVDTDRMETIATIPTGSKSHGIAITPDGEKAYVTSMALNETWVIDISTNEVVAKIPVGNGPRELQITPDGRYAYLSNAQSNSVSVIDTSTDEVVTTISICEYPNGLRITENGKFVSVACARSDDVAIIDTSTNEVISRVPAGTRPHDAFLVLGSLGISS
ncbi:MAG: YncE family protein [Candidatus Hydrothermarchaeaceae archaeon]